MTEAPRGAVAPMFAALISAATVVIVTVVAQSGGSGLVFPTPVRPAPAPLDLHAQSLSRCAAAVLAAGATARYPPADKWVPLTRLSSKGLLVTMLDADVPFVCATGASTVDVSDPGSAVPIGTASLLLSTPSGVLAAAAPAGSTVEVAAAGGRLPGSASARYFLRVTAAPITDPSAVVAAIGDNGAVHQLGSPPRLAPAGLHTVDRRSVPADRSPYASDLLRRCADAAGDVTSWEPAQLLAYRRLGQPATLLVANRADAVGGCSVAPGEITPLRLWSAGARREGPRPFTWLPGPSSTLPGLGTDIAAGPVDPAVTSMEIEAGNGQRWRANVAGATFATQLPAGVPADPRALTVRAHDADGRLLYEGAAAG